MKNVLLFLTSFSLIVTFSSYADGTLVQGGFVSALVPPSPRATNGERLFTVYLPDGYDPLGSQTYPVVYFLPSFAADDQTFALANKIILDILIEDGLIIPMIVVHMDPSLVVGTDSSGNQQYLNSWYVNSALNGAFETYLITELIPYINVNFNTMLPGSSAFRGIMGHSAGGFGALLHGTRYPNLFCAIGAASPTPTWLMTSAMATPGNALFFLNSAILNEIPTAGPDAGKITPNNGPNTFLIFSLAAALSPHIGPGTPFETQYMVDMPFLINPNGTPVLVASPNQGVDFLDSSVCPTPFINFPNTLVLDPAVVARWNLNDPFQEVINYIATLQKQAIYIDAGTLEPANNVGARFYSDLLTSNNIDHEYLLYIGRHDSCLTTVDCSRFWTIFQEMSAKFAEGGIYADDVRIKLLGNQIIVINGTMSINNGTFMGIETMPPGITSTNVTLDIQTGGKLLIGTDSIPGGGLQIGNVFGKAILANNPTFATNTVSGTININGSDAECVIGEQGFLGLGMGITGKYFTQPNQWAIKSLVNIQQIALIVLDDSFSHKQIASGTNTPDASLLALGQGEASAAQPFNVVIDPTTAQFRGGSNQVSSTDIRLQHPVVLTQSGIIPPGGIRPFYEPNPLQQDCYYRVLIGSTLRYANDYTAGITSSAIQLNNRPGSSIPHTLTNGTVNDLFTFLNEEDYLNSAVKTAAIALLSGNRIFTAIIDGTIIRRFPENQLIIGTNQIIDFRTIEEKNAAIGMQLETVGGQRIPIRVYDLRPEES